MTLETIIKAYLMAYWPDTGLTTTTAHYGLITLQFNETMQVGDVSCCYEPIGMVMIAKPAEYVLENAYKVYEDGWKKLQEAGVEHDRNVKCSVCTRIKNAGMVDSLIAPVLRMLFGRYMAGDARLRYFALSPGSAALN